MDVKEWTLDFILAFIIGKLETTCCGLLRWLKVVAVPSDTWNHMLTTSMDVASLMRWLANYYLERQDKTKDHDRLRMTKAAGLCYHRASIKLGEAVSTTGHVLFNQWVVQLAGGIGSATRLTGARPGSTITSRWQCVHGQGLCLISCFTRVRVFSDPTA